MEDTVELFTLMLADGMLGPNCKGSLLERRTRVASDRRSLGSPGTHRVLGEDGDFSRPKSPCRILTRPHRPQSRHGRGYTPTHRVQSATPQSVVGVLGRLRRPGPSRRATPVDSPASRTGRSRPGASPRLGWEGNGTALRRLCQEHPGIRGRERDQCPRRWSRGEALGAPFVPQDLAGRVRRARARHVRAAGHFRGG